MTTTMSPETVSTTAPEAQAKPRKAAAPRLKRGAVKVFLNHTLGAELATLLSLKVGQAYEPGLRAGLAKMEADMARPIPEDDEEIEKKLDEAMAEQDRIEAAVRNELEAVRLMPRLPPAVKDAEARVSAALYGEGAPSLRDLPPGKRGEQAEALASKLPGLAADLALLTTRVPGETVGDWLSRWCDLGTDVVELYAQTGRRRPEDRRAAGTELNRVVGVVNRLRVAVRDEVSWRPELPATTEEDLFGLWDNLHEEARQERRKPRRAASSSAGAAEPAAPPAASPEPAASADSPAAPAVEPAPAPLPA